MACHLVLARFAHAPGQAVPQRARRRLDDEARALKDGGGEIVAPFAVTLPVGRRATMTSGWMGMAGLLRWSEVGVLGRTVKGRGGIE